MAKTDIKIGDRVVTPYGQSGKVKSVWVVRGSEKGELRHEYAVDLDIGRTVIVQNVTPEKKKK